VTARHRAPGRFRSETAVILALALIGGTIALAIRAAGRGAGDDRTVGSPSGVTSPPSRASGFGPQPPRERLVIHGTGDVSLDPTYIPAFRSRGYGWAWSGLSGLFRKDDLTVINLECPATDVQDPETKQFVFRCDPAGLPVARSFGVEVANQANNHAYDQGPDGLVDSLAQIGTAGLAAVGAGRNQAQALRAASFDLQGWRVAVLGIDEVLDPLYEVAGPDKPGTAAGHDFGLALRAVRDAAKQADIVVVMIHWGVELDTRPRSYQVSQAHRMIEAGADVVFGGHSHRLQPMETYRGRPIFYSLGNFVWPHLSVEGSTTAVAEVTVSPKGRFGGRLLPVSIESDGHPVLR
jgi:poly-gamma-glutamate capsule biosynthesis protein CapA/YwtB (metallophosphatase superfamily)